MSENAQAAYDAINALIGSEPVAGDWFTIDQDRIQAFADATLDHQFIHLDPERAAQTPFGGTIAHGFLTLSLLVHLSASIPTDLPKLEGVLMGVNYGMNKVRFVNPVPTGSRVRATASTVAVTIKGNAVDQTRAMTVEIEGVEKPALVAEWIGRTVFAYGRSVTPRSDLGVTGSGPHSWTRPGLATGIRSRFRRICRRSTVANIEPSSRVLAPKSQSSR
jgi:acyl dehydratase